MVSERDIEHIAELADIGISKDEVPEFTTQFNAIIDYFEVLDTVEGESAPATVITNVFREDEPRPCLSQEEALVNAGSTENGFIRAPRVM
ncbi:Asp-tRNA(Asn)/Glu-tRNA(Gln) amidotransferase subunit GatC [Methanoculleus sp.]|uniref:Asp-tRNA(Asn)/Glu-tRNA(Gln) amidotransferase subunit GatC n=1 Tax=Methanoculleus sp. TaxID=90427 RepID=UPI002FCCB238